MSRVGMNPIPVPDGVDVAIDGAHVTVTGNRGSLEHDLPETITARIEDGFVIVERADEQRNTKALHGLSRFGNQQEQGQEWKYTNHLPIYQPPGRCRVPRRRNLSSTGGARFPGL